MFIPSGLEKGITTLINHGSDDIAHIIISLCGTRDSEKLLKKPAQIICLDKQGGNSPRFIWGLARVIRAVRPDVVHTRNWSGMDGILAARLAGVKAIVHGEHGWDMLDPASFTPAGPGVKQAVRQEMEVLPDLLKGGIRCK